jgi:predicted flap endonuclease-1-like 5' DNA nuclease
MFQNLNSMDKSTAILEIMIMLFVAFAIGFVIAWLLRKSQSNRMTILDADNARMQGQITVLEKERAHLITRSGSLEAELDECIKSMHACSHRMETSTEMKQSDLDNAQKLGFRPTVSHQKDDIKLISGIGPFIEKKLNKLGIYTYEQISEFSPDTIHKVTDAIEFFPGRIERDHWVDQARHFMQTIVN